MEVVLFISVFGFAVSLFKELLQRLPPLTEKYTPSEGTRLAKLTSTEPGTLWVPYRLIQYITEAYPNLEYVGVILYEELR